VVLQFSQRLAYNTHYTVTVKPSGLKSLQYAFTTEQPQVYYLHQEGISTADAILSRSLGGGLEKTVYKHADIASFIVVDNALIINVRNKDYSNSLYKLNLKNGNTTEIRLPKAGSVIQLQAAPSRKVFGFTFTSKGYEKNLNNILVTYNLSTGTLTKTNGFDKQPLQTLSWDFGPDSNTLVVQLYDNSTILATADNTTQPLPLGQLAVGGLTPDGSKAIMSNSDGAIEVTLKSNAKRTLPMPTGLGTDTFVTTATPLNEGQGYMLYGQSFFGDHYGEYLIMHAKDTDRHLYVSGKTESIASFALSPNDRYAAIDTLLFANGVSKHHLHVIDTQTGKSVLTSDGGAPAW
jgi:WD40 repeat protein